MRNIADDIQDLIQEAKLRTVWWILCVFAVTYFMTHTSKSMLLNIPIAILLVSGLRILFNEVEFHWKVRNARVTSYLSHLEKKQLPVNDSRLRAQPSPKEWKRKFDSPVVEAAIEDFVDKALRDFVIDLWYSFITPDKEAPELIHDIVMDALGEVSGRVKEVNLVDLLTRDIVDLIGDHIDLFRRNQLSIGRDVMGTLSSEERDERLKHHLMASKELHPALISPECEYKVIQQLMGGLLATVLPSTEAQCPLVRCIARELLSSLIIQPIMSFASPGYINQLIEYIILTYNEWFKDVASGQFPNLGHSHDHTVLGEHGPNNQGADESLSRFNTNREVESGASRNLSSLPMQDETIHSRPAEWAKVFEAASQRRTEVLTPENLENMWTIGRDYKKRLQKKASLDPQAPEVTSSLSIASPRVEDKASEQLKPLTPRNSQSADVSIDSLNRSEDINNASTEEGSTVIELEDSANGVSHENGNKLKRSNSSIDLEDQPNLEHVFTSIGTAPIITESNTTDANGHSVDNRKNDSDMVLHNDILHPPKLRCRVIGAYFEKLDSNSFAVYSICVTDTRKTTWLVRRRYRNFERLHRHLKDIPNYNLHLPPKRIFSSSTENAFVHQRCVQLDKYLQDLLSIANVAEQHEVWDFLSASSKNYSFGKSSSVMTTLAVNVDDAVDDIVRQFKGVSDGLMRIMVGSVSSSDEPASSLTNRNMSWNSDDTNKLVTSQNTLDSLDSFSDNEEGDKDVNPGQPEQEDSAQANGWHSDNELKEDPSGVPPEWAPPNLTVPVLNLVDKVFQLKRRGWLRRQVFWISKQILQLLMEDAIDDWLLMQIQWLRRDDVIAQGIRLLQDIVWPDGTFFLKARIQSKLRGNEGGNEQGSENTGQQPESFEQQLEAARRASDVKKMIFDGAPTALVSFIGHKQYRRCARDIYYFLQSTVCLKQLGYAIVEHVLISIFPELRDVVRDIHEKMHTPSA